MTSAMPVQQQQQQQQQQLYYQINVELNLQQ